jgi:hypothetical protein
MGGEKVYVEWSRGLGMVSGGLMVLVCGEVGVLVVLDGGVVGLEWVRVKGGLGWCGFLVVVWMGLVCSLWVRVWVGGLGVFLGSWF